MSVIGVYDRYKISEDEIKMTKRGEEIHKHLKELEEELIENYAKKI